MGRLFERSSKGMDQGVRVPENIEGFRVQGLGFRVWGEVYFSTATHCKVALCPNA